MFCSWISNKTISSKIIFCNHENILLTLLLEFFNKYKQNKFTFTIMESIFYRPANTSLFDIFWGSVFNADGNWYDLLLKNLFSSGFFDQNTLPKFWFLLVKGTLMQIWKSVNIFVFIWKYVEDFILKDLLLFEIYAREICEKFVYKHSETIEYVKN